MTTLDRSSDSIAKFISALEKNDSSSLTTSVSSLPLSALTTTHPSLSGSSPLQYALSSADSTVTRTLLSAALHSAIEKRDASGIDTLVQQLVERLHSSSSSSSLDKSARKLSLDTKSVTNEDEAYKHIDSSVQLESPAAVRGGSLPSSLVNTNTTITTNTSTETDPSASLDARMAKVLRAIADGEFVVVTDSVSRENEGDLIMAAELATEERIAYMVNETSGLICVGMDPKRVDELQLPLMVEDNKDTFQTAFTVSVDYKHGTTTGISAADRALTIRALADPSISGDNFNKPGHMFPLRAKSNGTLDRPGHTEAAMDLTRLAGCKVHAGALCEIVNKDGSMARPNGLQAWAAEHKWQFCTIEDIIAYRKKHNV